MDKYTHRNVTENLNKINGQGNVYNISKRLLEQIRIENKQCEDAEVRWWGGMLNGFPTQAHTHARSARSARRGRDNKCGLRAELLFVCSCVLMEFGVAVNGFRWFGAILWNWMHGCRECRENRDDNTHDNTRTRLTRSQYVAMWIQIEWSVVYLNNGGHNEITACMCITEIQLKRTCLIVQNYKDSMMMTGWDIYTEIQSHRCVPDEMLYCTSANTKPQYGPAYRNNGFGYKCTIE